MNNKFAEAIEEVKTNCVPFKGSRDNYDYILNLIGEADFVLLGEATHGTAEFYRIPAELTKRLVTDKGFNALAVEADWPDAYRVNRYIMDRGEAPDTFPHNL